MRWKKILLHPRVILLAIVLLLVLVMINPKPGIEGAAIRQVTKASAAQLAGIASPSVHTPPTQREIVLAVDGRTVADAQEYYAAIADVVVNQSVMIQTDKNTYRLVALTTENDTNTTLLTAADDLGLVVYDAPTSNLRKGLDLSGGTRVILKPERRVSQDELEIILTHITQRLNVFGLSDIVVRPSKDLGGDDYILIEIAGAKKEEVRDLLGNQGVFEAKVANQTVFTGGDDIVDVCRRPECSGIDSQAGGCQPLTDGTWACRFRFSIQLSQGAADRQAAATKDLGVTSDGSSAYLTAPLELYLDTEKVDELRIAADLQGRAVTDIEISGSGSGPDAASAEQDAITNMKQLQTILITGSLPVKLEIVKTDAISPVLGEEFLQNAMLMGLAAMFVVAIVIFARYRRFTVSVPIIITMLSEVFITLGFASFLGQDLDLAGIAGIIITIGSGVNDQIVIIDETLRGEKDAISRSWKDRLKGAFFVIFSAYATIMVAMLPLLWAGVGLLKGFAIMTMIGVTAGVLVTRPAYAATVELMLKEE